MKGLLLNGANDENKTIETVQRILINQLNLRGYQVEKIILRDITIDSCRGCFGCWVKNPGTCATKDAGCDIMRLFVESDLVILLTPVTYGGYSYQLKKALDRVMLLLKPDIKKYNGESHHPLRYQCNPGLAVMGTDPTDEDSGSVFKALARRNALNLHPRGFSCDVFYENYTPEETDRLVARLLNEVEGDKS